MAIVKKFIENYFDFHYGLGCAIGMLIFSVSLYLLRRKPKGQVQDISKKEILCSLALAVYMVLLLGGTLLSRRIGTTYRMELIPFWSYYEVINKKNAGIALQILFNVLMFIPWGILLPSMWERLQNLKIILLCSVSVSLVIEVLQLVLRLGLFEFDDVVHNIVGTVIGYMIWRCWRKWRGYFIRSNSSISLS